MRNKKEKIVALLKQGLKHEDICEQVGCAKSTVSYHAKREGLSKKLSAGTRYDWEEIAAYQSKGHTFVECQEKFGVSYSAWHDAMEKGLIARKEKPPVNPFCKWSRRRNATNLKRRLLAEGLLEYRCYGEGCQISDTWLGKKLDLHLDHIDGDGTNNNIENLRLLCPNCHSQTDTYGAKNTSFYKNKYGKDTRQ